MDEGTALMQRALDAAHLGPEADPNPRVGCVVTAPGGEVVGVGHHRGAGTPHAEVEALAAAGDEARGGTAYVTLEPCSHTGRTGPCTEALLAAGVTSVVYAVADPDPVASGGGAWLAEHGVAVSAGVLATAADELNATWLHLRRTGRPWVTWKGAATLDGRTAAVDGTSRWITGAAARADVHALRARCGAVVVGTGTALADDPRLSARAADGSAPARQPLPVIVGHRDLPPGYALADDSAPTLHLRTHDPEEVLDALAERGVHHVLLEGGATLAAAFLRADLVDEVVVYLAPALLGSGAPLVGDLGATTITDTLRLRPRDVSVVGEDVRITAHLGTRS